MMRNSSPRVPARLLTGDRIRGGVIRTIGVFLLLGGVPGSGLASQDVGTRLPIEFRSWNLEGKGGETQTVTQLHVPLAVTWLFAPATRLVVATSGGSSRMSAEGADDLTLGGLADTEIQIYQNLPHASLLLSAGVQLPSGVSALSPEELDVTRQIANPILGMNLRQYGRGLDLNVGVAWSRRLEDRIRLSFGLGARLSGAYEVAAGTEKLEPGNQASATIDLSYRNESWERHPKSASLSTSVRVFGADRQAGEALFEEGTEVQVEARTALPLGSAEWRTRVSGVLKAENTAYDRTGQLAVPRSLASGTGIWLDSSLEMPWGSSVRVGPEVRARLFDGNDIENGDGWALELGPLLSLPFGDGSRLDLRGAYLLGSMGTGDDILDLNGFAVGLGTTWRVR